MDVSLIFVIVIMFYFCVIFPLQMRRYLTKRQQRQSRQTTNNTPPYTRTVAQPNNNNDTTTSEERSDNHLVFGITHTTPPESHAMDDAATRHLEAEHRQQIIEIQREIELQAIQRRDVDDGNGPHIPPKIINSTTVRDPVAYYSQQIIDLQREIERQAIRRQEDRLPDPFAPHMPPPRLNSTNRTSVYTITSDSGVSASNSSVNYPYAPPLTPDADSDRHIYFLHRPNSKDDELPSYGQAVAYDSATPSATISRV